MTPEDMMRCEGCEDDFLLTELTCAGCGLDVCDCTCEDDDCEPYCEPCFDDELTDEEESDG